MGEEDWRIVTRGEWGERSGGGRHGVEEAGQGVPESNRCAAACLLNCRPACLPIAAPPTLPITTASHPTPALTSGMRRLAPGTSRAAT